MKVLVIGCGLVGSQLASSLVAKGHHVTGTTTSPSRVPELEGVCSDVVVLRGSDQAAVHAAAAGADAVVVAAGPAAARAMTREERAATYHEVLVQTAESVVSAPGEPYLVALSSLSVYGDAADHLDEVTEDSPLTTADDPSPLMFQAMERTYLGAGAGRAAIFRCADVFGAGDPPLEAKITLAHDVLKGSIPFAADSLFYRIHVDDVVAAVEHALETRITGAFNLTHAEVPVSNQQLFDAVSARLGYPPLTYRGELVGPRVPVSTERLRATGFAPTRTPAHTSA